MYTNGYTRLGLAPTSPPPPWGVRNGGAEKLADSMLAVGVFLCTGVHVVRTAHVREHSYAHVRLCVGADMFVCAYVNER